MAVYLRWRLVAGGQQPGEGGAVTRTRRQDATCAGLPRRKAWSWSTKQARARAEPRDEERRQKWATDPEPNRPDACHSSAGGPCPIFVSKHLSGRQRLLGTNIVLQLCRSLKTGLDIWGWE